MDGAKKYGKMDDEVRKVLVDRLISEGEYEDAYSLIRDMENEVDGRYVYTEEAHKWAGKLRKVVLEQFKLTGEERYWSLYYHLLLFEAPYDFDSYCLYLEKNRPVENQFYINRRPQLKPVVEGLQALADDELDLLAISLPPGVGKSTLAIFYLTWLAGRNPDKALLGVSHSAELVGQEYEECLRILRSNEYCWKDVFPTVSFVGKNAKYQRIDLGKPKRFNTLQFTSVGSENSGTFRAQQLLYCDDLVSSQEQAMSQERMDNLWRVYTDDLLQRKQGFVKELHIATRWSVRDIIGRIQDLNEDNPRARFIQVNALNEKGESNFDYPYNLGFSTQAYLAIKNSVDEATWASLYMNEPFERKGLLYQVDRLRRFTEIPEDPEGVIAVCDTKSKGSDYCVLPVAYMYGNDCYIVDVVCDNADPTMVEEELVNMLVKHKVKRARFESNAAGWKIADIVSDKVKARGGYCSVETKWSQANKETKIQVEQPWVIDHCLFLTEDRQSPQYKTFMKMLTSYVQNGKNKHDDAPDAMAQLSQFVQGVGGIRASVIKRPF